MVGSYSAPRQYICITNDMVISTLLNIWTKGFDGIYMKCFDAGVSEVMDFQEIGV